MDSQGDERTFVYLKVGNLLIALCGNKSDVELHYEEQTRGVLKY
jgi:hypothetical protein